MVSVTISQGKLKGRESKSDNGKVYYEFLCVPYAKPPVGDLRFKSPEEPKPWDDERDGTSFNENNISCQAEMIKGNIIGSEDCLYLNVYTPKLLTSNSKLLPVMFYIHGGGFIYGNGINKQECGPDYLIDNDVVLVTCNYRLGLLGFLSLGIPEATGNMGLKDQVQALKWVQNNIEKFCGDRNNVTIFGMSAGSASVQYHLLSSLSRGLFHKAILQSGSALNHWAINFEQQKLNEKVLEEMGYNGSKQDPREIYEYLAASPSAKIIEASNKVVDNFTNNRIYFGYVPTIENDFNDGNAMLTEYPYKLLTEGRFNHVPIIMGFCNKEGYLSSTFKAKCVMDLIDKKNYTHHWAFEMEANDKKKYDENLTEAYADTNMQPGDEKDSIGVDFFSDFDFVSGVWVSANTMASKGVAVYLYEFCYDGKINFLKRIFGISRKGAAHGDDTCYVFKHTISSFAEGKDFEVRENLSKIWTNFAKTSNPTPDNDVSIHWPKYSEDARAYLNIDENLTIKNNYEPKKMAMFNDIYKKYKK